MCKSITLALLWANWGIITALAICYCVLGWMSFAFIKKTRFSNAPSFQNKITDSIRISLFISIMAVILHWLVALASHIREVMTERENFSYGYVGASSFLTAVIAFIASTQQANADSYFFNLQGRNNWGLYDTRIYRASYALGYVIMCFLLINFITVLGAYTFGILRVRGGKSGKARGSKDKKAVKNGGAAATTNTDTNVGPQHANV